jgi:hypothetical protein
MRLQIRRLGGIAGVTLRAQVDTAQMPAEQAARMDHAIRDLTGNASIEPLRPDAFRYEITQLDDPNQASILLNEHEIPAELHGLIDAFTESGEIERRDRSKTETA